jgi:hypothetical protein
MRLNRLATECKNLQTVQLGGDISREVGLGLLANKKTMEPEDRGDAWIFEFGGKLCNVVFF